jgi:transcriptional regulator with XRE-family HTH domain
MSKIISFGERLKQLRRSAKLTQPELAQKAGVSKGQVSLLENEDRKIFQDSFIKILSALGVTEEEFFSYFINVIAETDIHNKVNLSIPQDILDILNCDNETLKLDLILHAQKLKEMKAKLEAMTAKQQQLSPQNKAPKNSDSQTGDQDENDADLVGTWGF